MQSATFANGLNDWNTFTQDYDLDALGLYDGATIPKHDIPETIKFLEKCYKFLKEKLGGGDRKNFNRYIVAANCTYFV